MSMRRALLVARRDYVENLRTKAFWIGIILLPVLLVASIVIPTLLQRAKDVRRYAVLDESGWLLPAIEERAVGEDARRLLETLREKARGGDASLQRMPEPVRDLAVTVKDATDAQIDVVAKAFGGRPVEASDDLTPAIREKLARVQGDVRAWLAGLDAQQARAIDSGLSSGRYERVEIPTDVADPEAWLKERLKMAPQRGGLFAYFVIGPDPVASSEGCKYVSNNKTDPDLRQWLARLASEVVEKRRFEREGVAAEAARRIREPLRFEEKQISEGEETAVSSADKARGYAPIAFVYLLWMTVFMTAAPLLTNTVEEKSNKLIEVLLSSVSPLELMAGKIIGTAATGLTVVLAWMGCLFGAAAFGATLAGGGASFVAAVAKPVYLLQFTTYYLLGYLLYAAILVAMGSVCDSMKDAQGLMTPVTLLMVVPLFAMFPVSQDPNGTLAKVLSWFPPFTPFVMMNRAAGPPAWWEYAGTTLLLAATTVFAFWAAAKVFRLGILMTGKPPKPGEILRWLRAPVTAAPQRRDP